jgi:hypothetical protein
MPKFPTFPTLYDQCKQISISSLNSWGYLKPEQWKNGTITWSRGEGEYKEVTAEISITVNFFSEDRYMQLNYNYNGKPINYRVSLVSKPSNLGIGVVWFFQCPQTGKYCRKLYLVDTYFYHRTAFRGCMYEKQTESHKNHSLFKLFDRAKRAENAEEQIYSKHFKKYYNGKPTKRYSKLLKIAEQTISQEELERLYIA